jgi:hypothetical protein
MKKKVGLLQFLEEPVKRDGIRRDRCQIRSSSASLLKNFHVVRIHRRTRQKHIILAGQAVHPARALCWWLIRRNQRNLREIKPVPVGGVVSRCGDRAAYVDAFSVVPCIHNRKCQCHVSSHSCIAAPIRSAGHPSFRTGLRRFKNLALQRRPACPSGLPARDLVARRSFDSCYKTLLFTAMMFDS